ncbi:hypothetical protein PQX77_015138 [Marasmius sp. AFHP31]|nr:hypothetical protein PQX77_015138 [Marasmius sp. AFHP31]
MSRIHKYLVALLVTARIGGVLSIAGRSVLRSVPGRFIFELENGSSFKNPREALYDSLRSKHIGFEVEKEFASNDIFVGGTIKLSNSQNINQITNVPGLVAIHPVRIYSRPAPAKMQIVQSADDLPSDIQTTHMMTGVDRLHNQGITGEGINIGILDTGIDYMHPALGNGFGPGFKVIGGYDLVGDKFNGTNEPIPDSDPLDQCYGHGTHVAGIIGADPGNQYNISGVAYSASLSAYRIFGCTGDTTDDVVVEALLMAHKDGQDVLNLSIGESDGWTEGVSSVVASRIAASGTVVAIAAGNEGASGAWFTSAPGNALDAISVASVDSITVRINNATVQGVSHQPITYYALSPFPVNGSLPIYATSNDTSIPDDACEVLPDSTPDLSKFIVVIRRGSCIFTQKLANVAAKGAKYALIYDNGTGFGFIDIGTFTAAAMIQAADGEFLVKQYASGAPVQLSFPQTGGIDYPYPGGGLSSSFSNYGPTNDMFFKPSVSAPGGLVLSTYPTTRGYYGVASGTSMASPFVAGSAALILSVLGKSVAPDVRTRLETTAQPVLASHNGSSLLQTAAQQGAGLINVYNALFGTTKVWPGELLLNDTAHFVGEHQITVENTGNETRRYSLSHVPAGTAVTMQVDSIFPTIGPVPLSAAAAQVALDSTSLDLGPGQSQNITARFTLPTSPDASRFPVYSGFIQISSGNGSEVEVNHVSYLGLGASLRNKRVLDNTDVSGRQLPALLNASDTTQTTESNYTFKEITDGVFDYPRVSLRLAFGTPVLRMDLVSADFDLQTSHHGFDNDTLLDRYDYVSRNDETYLVAFSLGQPEPVFANDTKVPDGRYKYLLRALRVTGDPLNEDDYDKWLSPVVGYNSTGGL